MPSQIVFLKILTKNLLRWLTYDHLPLRKVFRENIWFSQSHISILRGSIRMKTPTCLNHKQPMPIAVWMPLCVFWDHLGLLLLLITSQTHPVFRALPPLALAPWGCAYFPSLRKTVILFLEVFPSQDLTEVGIQFYLSSFLCCPKHKASLFLYIAAIYTHYFFIFKYSEENIDDNRKPGYNKNFQFYTVSLDE